MKKVLIILVAMLVQAAVAAALDIRSSRQVDSTTGLSNNFVLSMASDGDGNVWVGTEAGLNRIAGKTVSVYRREQMGTDNDKILSLYYDSLGCRMLIGTEQQFLWYDCKSSTFCRDTHGDALAASGVACITSDHKGGVWLVYNNRVVQHLDCKTNRVTTLMTAGQGVRCAADDGDGNLYLGYSKDGMSMVSIKHPDREKRFTHDRGDSLSLPGNNVRCIRQDRHGRIWVGTGGGLALFDENTETFMRVRHPDRDSWQENVYDIAETVEDRLWVASDVGGIHIVDLGKGVKHLRYDDATVSLSSLNTRCILQDAYNNIWAGNHSTGVDFIASRKPFLHSLDFRDDTNLRQRIYAVASDGSGRLWMGGEDGLSLWTENMDGRLGEWPFPKDGREIRSFPRTLMADSRGYVWMGMEDKGVERFDTRSGRFETIDVGYGKLDVHTFYEDGDGRIWIGTEYGVCTYENGEVRRHEEIDRLTGRGPATGFVALSADKMLITTLGNGMFLLDLRRMTARQLTMTDGLPSNHINQVVRDHRRGFWLATNEGIAYLPDATKPEGIKVYEVTGSQADHRVLAIQQDYQGRIWGTTYSGIVCLDTTTGQLFSYNRQKNTGGFMEGATATTAAGYIVFCSPTGILYFNPKETDMTQKVSAVRIVLLEAYTPTAGGNATITPKADSEGCYVVDYRQNTLRLAYTVDDFSQVDDVEFSYKMEGLGDKWYFNGSDHDVMFRNLRPGDYTFVLRAKLIGQDWENAAVTTLRIRITPPFWQTWWAYVVYILLIVGGIAYLFRQYKRRLALHNSLEIARRESRQKQELNEERLRFFTNITHELRTPLTLILGPLEDLIADKQLSGSCRRKVEMINKSAQRLRDLINEILEFRKTETQNRRLTVARGDLGRFVREIALNYKELNRNPAIEFRIEIADNLPKVYFDSEVITTVLNNLLSNAIKYTEKGSITIQAVTDGDDRFDISVADTGYGIAADALPHIFDRYYQAKGSHQASGTGIGLALVKSLADLHEAALSVNSHEGKGSTFTLSLTVHNSYPNALHKEDRDEEKAVEKDGKTETPADDEQEKAGLLPLLLVVEDNADIRQYIADSFAEDFRMLQAENGEEGLAVARAETPDIIVSDIMMPKMNGIELTRRLREDIRTSHIPVVLLTAKDSDEDKEAGYDCGADSYLTKPFTARLLGSRIKNLLASRRRLAELLTTSGNHMAAPPVRETPAAPQAAVLTRLDSEFMQRLNSIIEDNIMQEDIDMAFLTDKMAMSHSTFYRKVKALTGLTANEYVRKRRLNHCMQLLESGDYNVSEAAMMTGFNQMAHFRSVFKKEFGILPSEVVAKAKKI